MGKVKNKYPGFIDGLKASNISTNRVSLDVYSKQLSTVLLHFNEDNQISEMIRTNLHFAEQTLQATENETNIENLIGLYIKVGNVLKTIAPSLKAIYPDEFKDAVISYLNIAQYTKDTRVNNLAIDIAHEA